jgi:hypothetical protein
MMDKSSIPTAGQRIGFIFVIFILITFMVFVNNLQSPYLLFVSNFITEDFDQCLWAINLYLAVSIFVNFIFMFFYPAWFRHLMQVVMNIFSLISVFMFYRIFPLALPSSIFEQAMKGMLIFIMAVTVIGTIVEVVLTVRKLASVT